MRFSKALMAVAAASLATAPALASPSSVRASTEAGESSEAVGGFFIPLIAVVAIVLGVIVVVDEDSTPDSP